MDFLIRNVQLEVNREQMMATLRFEVVDSDGTVHPGAYSGVNILNFQDERSLKRFVLQQAKRILAEAERRKQLQAQLDALSKIQPPEEFPSPGLAGVRRVNSRFDTKTGYQVRVRVNEDTDVLGWEVRDETGENLLLSGESEPVDQIVQLELNFQTPVLLRLIPFNLLGEMGNTRDVDLMPEGVTGEATSGSNAAPAGD